MYYVICPECKNEAEVSPDAVGPERTWLLNDDEQVIRDDRPPSLFF